VSLAGTSLRPTVSNASERSIDRVERNERPVERNEKNDASDAGRPTLRSNDAVSPSRNRSPDLSGFMVDDEHSGTRMLLCANYLNANCRSTRGRKQGILFGKR